jgi:hypothetical protein
MLRAICVSLAALAFSGGAEAASLLHESFPDTSFYDGLTVSTFEDFGAVDSGSTPIASPTVFNGFTASSSGGELFLFSAGGSICPGACLEWDSQFGNSITISGFDGGTTAVGFELLFVGSGGSERNESDGLRSLEAHIENTTGRAVTITLEFVVPNADGDPVPACFVGVSDPCPTVNLTVGDEAGLEEVTISDPAAQTGPAPEFWVMQVVKTSVVAEDVPPAVPIGPTLPLLGGACVIIALLRRSAVRSSASGAQEASVPSLTLATCFPGFHRGRLARGVLGSGCPRQIWSR